MPNLDAEISKHNHKTLKENKIEKDNNLCNFRNKQSWPIGGKCFTKNVVYKATMSNKNKSMLYIGSTDREFKKRYYQHMYSFRHKKVKKESN